MPDDFVVPAWPVVSIELSIDDTVHVDGEWIPVPPGAYPRAVALEKAAATARSLGRPVRAEAREPDGVIFPLIVAPDGTVSASDSPLPPPSKRRLLTGRRKRTPRPDVAPSPDARERPPAADVSTGARSGIPTGAVDPRTRATPDGPHVEAPSGPVGESSERQPSNPPSEGAFVQPPFDPGEQVQRAATRQAAAGPDAEPAGQAPSFEPTPPAPDRAEPAPIRHSWQPPAERVPVEEEPPAFPELTARTVPEPPEPPAATHRPSPPPAGPTAPPEPTPPPAKPTAPPEPTSSPAPAKPTTPPDPTPPLTPAPVEPTALPEPTSSPSPAKPTAPPEPTPSPAKPTTPPDPTPPLTPPPVEPTASPEPTPPPPPVEPTAPPEPTPPPALVEPTEEQKRIILEIARAVRSGADDQALAMAASLDASVDHGGDEYALPPVREVHAYVALLTGRPALAVELYADAALARGAHPHDAARMIENAHHCWLRVEEVEAAYDLGPVVLRAYSTMPTDPGRDAAQDRMRFLRARLAES
ncbi:hypothetical protein [Embleya sp. NPDC050493]|uniref:hypothetical protein n=1 Tax=Embleya sp. NPDC050493 TaxID=3363989 RepID=UPI00379B48CE